MNPLLGQNMGRWAEVYFTSPPEKREQAVVELLRELQARQSSQQQSTSSTAEPASAPRTSSASSPAEAPPEVGFAAILSGRRTRVHDSQPRDSAPAMPRLRRAYAWAALAIAALALAYVAWRGERAISGKSATTPPPPALTKQSAPQAAEPAVTQAVPSEQASPPGNKPVAAPQAAEPAGNEPGTGTGPEQMAPAASPASTSAPTNPQPLPANGSEELSVAKSYLNGTSGRDRDSAEAVKWLWRAVAKQNAEATELLSELYLKGDGVPENCDQARVLLEAAARRGAKEAADRLSHLQDFGCQ
jgi:TPR repeat protein